MADTNIEWADKTWNPVVGCTKISPGCDHCYAERMACRLASNPQTPQYQDVVSLDGKSWNGKTKLVEGALMQPLTWRKPCRIFVGSMTDLFHKATPDEWLDRIFAVMALCPQHTFLVLTKRPDGMREYFSGLVHNGEPDAERWDAARRPIYGAFKVSAPDTAERIGYMGAFVKFPLTNVWLGVTAENQAMADYRVPILLDTPAAKRFVSYEPGLGAVDVRPWLPGSYECGAVCGCRLAEQPEIIRCVGCGFEGKDNPDVWGGGDVEDCPQCHGEVTGETEPVCPQCGEYMVQGHPDTKYISLVICGGESGPGARHMDIEWARSIKDQCVEAGVPFFYKQGPDDSGRMTKMPILDGRVWDQRP